MSKGIGLLAIAIALSIPAATAEEGVSLELFGSFEDPLRSKLFQTSIAWGELRVRGHDGAGVSVRARITTDRNLRPALTANEILEQIRLDLRERGNTIELVVDSRFEGFYGVDLEIDLPRDTAVALEVTRGGNVHAEGVDGEIDVTNRNGSVVLSRVGGAAVVNASNGSIEATFDRVDRELPMAFTTHNGSVDVTLPGDTSADLQIRYSRGGVESDFDIEVEGGDVDAANADASTLEPRITRLLVGRINGGGPRYRFETANGTVYLRRAGD